MKHYKLGLNHMAHTSLLAKRLLALGTHLDALGVPPSASFPWFLAVERLVAWGMKGNDTYGDCVEADDSHQLMTWTANGAGPFVNPSDLDTVVLYHAIAGPLDQGTSPDANAEYLRTTGFLGHKIDDWAPVDIDQPAHIQWGIHIFGGVKFCVMLPDFAEDDFETKGVWDYHGQAYKIEGGHDILAVAYNSDGTYDIITWGKRIKMTPAFASAFLTAVIAVSSRDVVMKSGLAPTGLQYDAMLQDLGQLRAAA